MSDTLFIDGLTVRRGAQDLLSDVSLTIAPGHILALLGPNGAGKSELVSTIAGELMPAEGTVTLGSQVLTGLKPQFIRRAGVAAVPEGHRVLSTLTVRDNLDAAACFLPLKTARAAFDDVMDIFPELTPKLDLAAGLLSGGQQQMLSLAQALITKPKFILADEMSFGLAPVIVRRLIPLLKTVAETGVGVLLIEQYTEMALEVADEVAVLNRGRLIGGGLASEFKGNPDKIRDLYMEVG
jgi:branched-chain amino acid transport system ATP-binding protein